LTEKAETEHHNFAGEKTETSKRMFLPVPITDNNKAGRQRLTDRSKIYTAEPSAASPEKRQRLVVEESLWQVSVASP
jgi:hypothetical protein